MVQSGFGVASTTISSHCPLGTTGLALTAKAQGSNLALPAVTWSRKMAAPLHDSAR